MAQVPLKVFISYKWEDNSHNEWVRKFATDLRAAGIDAILDRWEVRLGDSLTDYMTSKIKEADVVLFIITVKSVAAVEARKNKGGALKFEVQMAMSRKIAGEKMRLIGILRKGKAAPAHLRDCLYADFRNDSEYEDRLNELVDDLLDGDNRPPLLAVKKLSKSIDSKPTDVFGVNITEKYENGFLIIDSTPLLHEEGKIWNESIGNLQAVKTLLDNLWSKLRQHLPAHTYGNAWVLRNQKTGDIYWDLAMDLAAYHGLDREAITLEDVGLKSGMTLEIVPLNIKK